MAFASAFRRILNGSSTPSLNIRSQISSIRLSSTLPTLTSPKLFISVLPLFKHEGSQKRALVSEGVIAHQFLNSHETGLSRMTTDENLFNAFAPFGNLREAKVITDRGSGRSKGFGFVSYETVEEAEKAREGMNAKFLDGWVIFVDPARPREAPQQPPPRRDMQSNETGFTTNRTVGWSGY